MVQAVASARYERELPTVITSGFGKGDLVVRYGDAVARRMATHAANLPLSS